MPITQRDTAGARAFRADLSDPRHGTTNGYGNLHCRCERCRTANTAAHNAYAKQHHDLINQHRRSARQRRRDREEDDREFYVFLRILQRWNDERDRRVEAGADAAERRRLNRKIAQLERVQRELLPEAYERWLRVAVREAHAHGCSDREIGLFCSISPGDAGHIRNELGLPRHKNRIRRSAKTLAA